MRGEYPPRLFPRPAWGELPPRARRILPQGGLGMANRGTTSACAENTFCRRSFCFSVRNYLRVRGEYLRARWGLWMRSELPPRARRIRIHVGPRVTPVGTTSACAENTTLRIRLSMVAGNYLRVRGEYAFGHPWCPRTVELPPRARRIHICYAELDGEKGTTSACAENTAPRYRHGARKKNYLRVRGEYH